jgi:uncharacterized membrane protein YjjP (DUF1212 family)
MAVQEARTAPSAGADRKTPLDRTALAEIVELALWTGRLLMAGGAETQRVEEGVRTIGVGLGADWGNVVITHSAIIVTYFGGGDFRTKVLSVPPAGVDMSLIEAMSHLCHRVDRGELDAAQVRAALRRIEEAKRAYSDRLKSLAAGLGCAAFCRLFGGDWPSFGVTFAASSLAMLVRLACLRRRYDPLLVTGLTALIAASLVGFARVGATPDAALAASVVLLVPGNAAIGAVEDLIKGHAGVGLARAALAALVVVFATLGLLAAVRLTSGTP